MVNLCPYHQMVLLLSILCVCSSLHWHSSLTLTWVSRGMAAQSARHQYSQDHSLYPNTVQFQLRGLSCVRKGNIVPLPTFKHCDNVFFATQPLLACASSIKRALVPGLRHENPHHSCSLPYLLETLVLDAILQEHSLLHWSPMGNFHWHQLLGIPLLLHSPDPDGYKHAMDLEFW